MIGRLILVALIIFGTCFAFSWAILFSNYMTKERLRALLRCAALSLLAAVITIGLVACVINLDVFFHNTITG